jgi:predicted dehydrogenase
VTENQNPSEPEQKQDPAASKHGLVIVGTGFGCLTHLPAFRAAGFDVRALVGRDPEKTAARAERFGVPHTSTSLSDALALPGVTAVSIATPPHTHLGLVLEAVAAGKHVVCEKPFALDADDARTMLDAAERAGVVHMIGTEFRFGTAQALLRRVVAEGAIGRPRLATMLLHIPLLADPSGEIPDWWGDASTGGGWLGAQGSHLIDQIRTTLGEISGVSAGLTNLADRKMTAEDTFTVHFRTVSGVDGVIQSSASSWGRIIMETRIAGSTGTAWIHGDDVHVADASGHRKADVPADLVNPPAVGPPADLLTTAYDMLHFSGVDLAPYTRLAEAFRERIAGRPGPADPVPATFADGVAAVRVLDAIRLSAAERRWVDLSS